MNEATECGRCGHESQDRRCPMCDRRKWYDVPCEGCSCPTEFPGECDSCHLTSLTHRGKGPGVPVLGA